MELELDLNSNQLYFSENSLKKHHSDKFIIEAVAETEDSSTENSMDMMLVDSVNTDFTS